MTAFGYCVTTAFFTGASANARWSAMSITLLRRIPGWRVNQPDSAQ